MGKTGTTRCGTCRDGQPALSTYFHAHSSVTHSLLASVRVRPHRLVDNGGYGDRLRFPADDRNFTNVLPKRSRKRSVMRARRSRSHYRRCADFTWSRSPRSAIPRCLHRSCRRSILERSRYPGWRPRADQPRRHRSTRPCRRRQRACLPSHRRCSRHPTRNSVPNGLSHRTDRIRVTSGLVYPPPRY
jgi:hypothetical protein